MFKFNAKVGVGVRGGGGAGLRSKSRIIRICLYLRKNTSRGVRASQSTFSSICSCYLQAL